MASNFPLVAIQPVSDVRNAWVALLLSSPSAIEDQQLSHIFGDFGLAEALGPLSCVVMHAEGSGDLAALPAKKTILCLPVAYATDAANFPALANLKTAGFGLMASGLPKADESLFDGVSALALPCPGKNPPDGASGWLGKLPGPHMALGAEEITCPGRCHFSWFAGNFSTHGKAEPAKSGDAPNRALLLDLLSKVTNDAESSAIEGTIKRDPQLSYHLLKLVNSVAFALTTKINSFGQAITLLGRRQLQRWLQLLLYARSQKEGVANPLLPRAAFRAGLIESLCQQAGGSREDQDRAFMVGMFSLLDKLFGMPIAEVVKPLNLSEDVVAALTTADGNLGKLLAVVQEGEQGASEALAARLADAGIAHENWARALAFASRWAVQVSQEA